MCSLASGEARREDHLPVAGNGPLDLLLAAMVKTIGVDHQRVLATDADSAARSPRRSAGDRR